MATYTAAVGGGNWNNTATWGGSGYPVAGDTAIIGASANAITVNVNSACATLNLTGTRTLTYQANLTVSGDLALSANTTSTHNGSSYYLYVGGNITSGGTKNNLTGTLGALVYNGTGSLGTFPMNVNFNINTTGTLTLTNGQTTTFGGTKTVSYTAGSIVNTGHTAWFTTGQTVATNGMTWGTAVCNTSAILSSALQATVITNYSNSTISAMAITGAYDITTATLRLLGLAAGTSFTMPSGQTLNVTTNFYIDGSTLFSNVTFKSSTASAPIYLNYSGTMANCKCSRGTFTDVDASSGNRIQNLFGGTVTRCSNIYEIRNSSVRGAGATLVHLN